MDTANETILRQYAWSYFAFHADQRMKTFHFFILAAGLLAGGIMTLLKSGASAWSVVPLGALLTALSIIFWKLDRRNRALVRNGEEAIKSLDLDRNLPKDKDGGPNVLSIFERDDYLTSKAKPFFLIPGYFGYSRLLGAVFLLFAALGLIFVVTVFQERVPNKSAQTMPAAGTPAVAKPAR